MGGYAVVDVEATGRSPWRHRVVEVAVILLDEGLRTEEVFATLVTHYWANLAFLPGERAILNRVEELAHIPAVLIHGRHDVSGPVITPWRLHRRWPASRLIVVEGEGHWGPEATRIMTEAISGFARQGEWGA